MLDLGEFFVKNMNIFRKVCEVMSNRGKKLAFTTATIAAIATVGSNVNAEEVTTPVAPSKPVAEATTETKTTTVSDEQVLDAQDKVSDAKADKQAKETALTEAEAKRDAKAEEKAAAQAEEKALTEKVEAAKEATPEKVADLERTAKDKTADKEAKSQAVNNAKTDQTAKQTDVDNKTNALEAAKANQTVAADKVKAAEDALSGTAVKSAQDAKDAADKKVNDATATKDAADKELADSKKADAKRDAKKAQITSEIPAKETTASKATDAVKAAEKALDSIPMFTNIEIDAEWAKVAKEYLAELGRKWYKGLSYGTPEYKAAEKAYDQKLDELGHRLDEVAKGAEEKARKSVKDFVTKLINGAITNVTPEQFVERNEDGTEKIYDINNLPEDVLNEVNDQFITTLNEIRRALGLPDARINAKNVEFAKEVAKRYVANNITFINHSGKSIAEAAKALGYKYDKNALTTETHSQWYENLTTFWYFDGIEKDGRLYLPKFGLKRYASVSAILFMMEGAGGHFKALSRDSIQGAAYSTGSDERGNTILQLHVLNANSFANVPGFAPQIKDEAATNRALPETDRTTAQAKLDQAKADKVAADKAVADAKAELARINAEVSTTPAKQAEANKAAKALEDAKATQAAANKRLQDVSADNATKLAALNQARADKATADSNVTAKEQELVTATAALEAAKQTTATREKELENAVQAEKEAKKAVENAKELLANKTKLEADLAAKKAEVQKHCDDLKALENDVTAKTAAKTAAETALADAEKEYNRLLAIYTAERMVEPLIQDELPEFVGGVNYGEDLVFELPELMIPEETPVVSNLAAAGNSNATLGQAVHNEGRGTVVNEEQLPNTGTGSEFAIFSTAALSILASLGLVATNRKKTQE